MTSPARHEPEDHGHDSPGAPGAEVIGALLARASSGDQAAWRDLVGLYARRVFALAHSRLHNHDAAEEVTQSVFCTIAAKLTDGGYAERGRFEAWLFRVAMNRVRDEVRRARHRATPTDSDTIDRSTPAPRASQPGATPDHAARLGALRSALDLLSDADRQIIELRHHAGLSFAAISEALSEPLGTLLARHHRALKKLKEHLTTGPAAPAAVSIAGSRAQRERLATDTFTEPLP
jgi:RNA polymerase sigma-70 factor (ECF subfamily)